MVYLYLSYMQNAISLRSFFIYMPPNAVFFPKHDASHEMGTKKPPVTVKQSKVNMMIWPA
jgi:hypothetical protein